MTRTRYTMPARSQGKLHAQRTMARLDEKDVHRWAFVSDLQVMYIPHVIGPMLARTHVVLNNTPPLPSVAQGDEAVEVNARGLSARDAVKAMGLNPHMSVCGWVAVLLGRPGWRRQRGRRCGIT